MKIYFLSFNSVSLVLIGILPTLEDASTSTPFLVFCSLSGTLEGDLFISLVPLLSTVKDR